MILNVDLALWSLVIFLNAVGLWLSKAKLKDAVIPVTVILGVLSVLLATVWGYMTGNGTVTSYGLPNGIICWICCTQLYDFIHESFTKRKDSWSNLWSSIRGIFSKNKEAK